MPQRFLRPGITTSEAWNLASWFEQSFYIRLITLVDDAGRYDARVDVLHSYCFPLRHDVKRQETAAARSRLHELGLIHVYQVDGKEYLQIEKWSERVRNRSKFPDPPANRQPTAADGCQILPPSPSPSPSPSPCNRSPNPRQPMAAENTEQDFIDSLKLNPAYKSIDLDRELWKMRAWLLTPKGKGRLLTKKFILNWLNKIDVPIGGPIVTSRQRKLDSEWEEHQRRLKEKRNGS